MLLCATSVAAAALVTVPDQDTPVIDLAGVLDAGQRQKLVDLLHELKKKTGDQTGDQIKVLTVPSLAGEDIFAFAQRHYDLWKLGQKGSDKAALIVLAPTERKVRIHTGYGLEGALPDSWCGTLSRSIAQKYFVRREFGPGLVELTQAIVQRVAKEAGVTITGLPPAGQNGGPDDDLVFQLIVLVLVLVFLFNLYRQWKNRGNGQRWGSTAPGWGWNSFPRMGGSGGGWTGGDWSGGGGGGGWSSGGSDFGGGGSSGGGGGGASW